ncbi:hypothetical protein ACMA1I_17565 [Pontibacter sp. 13R65]|uniref:hypothetical protein n=1 Tax=Pontibacter sp. 13R65 TaxID=3127458 RepID=UPI00301CAC84
MKKRIALLPVLSLLILSACDKEPDCQYQRLPVTSFEKEYGCSNTLYEMDVKLPLDQPHIGHKIVSSQSQYDSLVTSTTCNPQIDFSAYDLVIGKVMTDREFSSAEYVLRNPCSSDTLSLVVVLNNSTQSPTIISSTTYSALIPKLSNNHVIDVTISYTLKLILKI